MPMPCPRCGALLPRPGHVTCTNCGTPYHWNRHTGQLDPELGVWAPERRGMLIDGLRAARWEAIIAQ